MLVVPNVVENVFSWVMKNLAFFMEKTCEQNMNLSSGCESYLSSSLKMHLPGIEDKKKFPRKKGDWRSLTGMLSSTQKRK